MKPGAPETNGVRVMEKVARSCSLLRAVSASLPPVKVTVQLILCGSDQAGVERADKETERERERGDGENGGRERERERRADGARCSG